MQLTNQKIEEIKTGETKNGVVRLYRFSGIPIEY